MYKRFWIVESLGGTPGFPKLKFFSKMKLSNQHVWIHWSKCSLNLIKILCETWKKCKTARNLQKKFRSNKIIRGTSSDFNDFWQFSRPQVFIAQKLHIPMAHQTAETILNFFKT